MCSITGAVPLTPTARVDAIEYGHILSKALERGRDAWGVATTHSIVRSATAFDPKQHLETVLDMIDRDPVKWVIGLNRGEPTTEHFNVGVHELSPHEDGQINGGWTTVHNGTIANDHELAEKFRLGDRGIDSRVLPYVFGEAVRLSDIPATLQAHVKGSYAIAAGHKNGTLVLACNYKPIFHAVVNDVLYFASLPHFLPSFGKIGSTVQKMTPYSTLTFNEGLLAERSLQPLTGRPKVLVVLSGGLDSTVVAARMVERWGAENVGALHVSYGCHATLSEHSAVIDICKRLGIDLHLLATDAFEAIGGSTLLKGSGADAVSGQAGSEYAHEWVPARNLILASLATGLAETEGYTLVALGNNLEESGAYPDNEQEFIRALNAVMPNAVQEGRRVQFIEPVGNLMKHEIVKLGLDIGAPLDLTYSCYRGGKNHCGTCGPCFMRHNAFRMNNAVDPLPYDQEVEMPA